MKIKHLALVVAGLAFSSAALATKPANYDMRFNISAEVPDSVLITDPEGNPITELDIRLTPAGSSHAGSTQSMSADTQSIQSLRLWSNVITDTKVKLTLDDNDVATGSAFALTSNAGGQLNKMNFKVSALETDAAKYDFVNSGDNKDYTLTTVGAGDTGHAEKEIAFVFESTKAYTDYSAGGYSGVVYANVAVTL
ncbi:hypothetical protein [Pragia fontium]|uniref:hypothetical protein n=1 Tax=Pragia fontium TaxID=82985 RepID=UPI00064AFAE6|nr:hypothetical protein [Pragia fontium]AKJ41129.1 hypothetical protein QQ39_02720 [Pragia fontium]